MEQHKSIGIVFANYNYAFSSFYEQYKNLCLKISEKTNLHDIPEIRKIIATFVYENEYAIKDRQKRNMYRTELLAMKRKADDDQELKAALSKDLDYTANKIQYRRKYYEYFKEYLLILGGFISELTATYMPNTNIQKKLLKFSNNQMFFEKFTQHKEKVLDSLSEFDIRKFTSSFNMLVTFYFAYSLFINEEDKTTLNNMLSYGLSYYLLEENLSLFAAQDPSSKQITSISRLESGLHRLLLFCLSLMNQSFSNYDVLPKLQNKIYLDRTLI